MKTLFLSAVVCTAFATMASAETYRCELASGKSGGWIRPVVMVKIDPDQGAAHVQDDLTNRYEKGWYTAKLSVDNAKRYSVVWDVKGVSDKSNQKTAHLHYRLSIQKKNLKANASMKPQGYTNQFTTSGRCKIHKG